MLYFFVSGEINFSICTEIEIYYAAIPRGTLPLTFSMFSEDNVYSWEKLTVIFLFKSCDDLMNLRYVMAARTFPRYTGGLTKITIASFF